MKKIYNFLILFSICSMSLNAQLSFSDDFESYNVGDYVGQQSDTWSTWSQSTGGAEDAKVTDTYAASGNNSIFFRSTAEGGGPQDVVLPFGAKYTTGVFDMSLNIYVDEGTGAYWNFQGETAIGTTWAHNCYFLENGELQFSNSDNVLALSTSYNKNEWINISYHIDLDKNSWQISVDGECLGSFSNGFNGLASMDIFPLLGNVFYIDDVAFDYNPESTILDYDVALKIDPIDSGNLTGSDEQITGTITNIGAQTISSATLDLNTNNGTSTYSFDNINIASGATYDFTIEDLYTIQDGANPINILVKDLNGGAELDQNQCNSKFSTQILGVTPAEGKNIVVEEGTGTWCGWCPRGAVFLDGLSTKYGDRFIGVAVHNNDPMTVSDYDGKHGFSGYPGATVMRRSADTGFATINDLEIPFLTYISQAPKATFDIGAQINADRNLNISVDVTANVDLTNEKIMLIITEDDIQGTESGYNQSNYYAGGSNGIMGGYEILPNPVPAGQMIYNHVARAIPIGFDGDAESFANILTSGNNRVFNYEYTVPATYNLDNMHIVAVIINADGTIDNGQSSSINDAIENGFLTGTPEILVDASDLTIFPNPSSDILNVKIELSEKMNVKTSIFNVMGQLKFSSQNNLIQGQNNISLDINTLSSGSYYLVVEGNDKRNVVQFVKQ